MPNLGALKTRVLAEVGRNSHYRIDDAALNAFANEAIEWLIREYPTLWWLRIQHTFPGWVALQTTLEMPTDFNVLIAMRNITQQIDMINVEEDETFNWVPVSPIPVGPTTHYFEDGMNPTSQVAQFGVWRLPSTGDVIQMEYYRQAIENNIDGVRMDIPRQFDLYIKDYMVSKAAELAQDYDLARLAFSRYRMFVDKHGPKHDKQRVRKREHVAQRLSQRNLQQGRGRVTQFPPILGP